MPSKLSLQSTFQNLPEIFFQKTNPIAVSNPQIVLFNHDLKNQLGLAIDEDPQLLSGNKVSAECHPIAQAYAGHQFGHFNILGDGRAHLLGEFKDKHGKTWDLALKGSGRTPYSRGGDGRAALGPMLREYIISEAMVGLKIPSTRSLAVVSTGEPIYREEMQPGAILTRIAASHIRVGTFEFAAATGGPEAVKNLADYAIQRHYPQILNHENPYLELLKAVIAGQAFLISKWMNVGFIHGVMNTDNMSISGETIDYGPCAFMDEYDPNTVFSSIDRQGRYAYGNQPGIAQWNLTRFAETLLPLLDNDSKKSVTLAEDSLQQFSELFQNHYENELGAKLGLRIKDKFDHQLFEDLFKAMLEAKLDYTKTFYLLSYDKNQKDPIFQHPLFSKWLELWKERIQIENSSLSAAQELMKTHNPVVIPRNHLVESALESAVKNNDLKPTLDLIAALKNPYLETSENLNFRPPPAEIDQNYKTFCGT